MKCSSLTSQCRQTQHAPGHDASQPDGSRNLSTPVRRLLPVCTTLLKGSGNLGVSEDEKGSSYAWSTRRFLPGPEMSRNQGWRQGETEGSVISVSPLASALQKVSLQNQLLLQPVRIRAKVQSFFFQSFLPPKQNKSKLIKISLQNCSNKVGRTHFKLPKVAAQKHRTA